LSLAAGSKPAIPPTVQIDAALLLPKPPDSVAFAAFGDTDVRSLEGLRAVARAVTAVCAAAGCDFVTLLGDNFYPLGVTSDADPLFQTTFEEPFAGVAAPFFAVLGNHDYGASRGNFFPDRVQHQISYSARSKKWRMPARWWRATQGPVDLFGIDTTASLYGLDDGQAAALADYASSSKAPWRIALGHHPYRSNGPHGNPSGPATRDGGPSGDQLKAFLEHAVCGHMDVYLAGHDHNLEWMTETCGGKTELLVSGAAANTSELPGRNPTRFQASQLGFLYARASPTALTAHFVGADGKVLFTRELRK
jgi:hypothetical protein